MTRWSRACRRSACRAASPCGRSPQRRRLREARGSERYVLELADGRRELVDARRAGDAGVGERRAAAPGRAARRRRPRLDPVRHHGDGLARLPPRPRRTPAARLRLRHAARRGSRGDGDDLELEQVPPPGAGGACPAAELRRARGPRGGGAARRRRADRARPPRAARGPRHRRGAGVRRDLPLARGHAAVPGRAHGPGDAHRGGGRGRARSRARRRRVPRDRHRRLPARGRGRGRARPRAHSGACPRTPCRRSRTTCPRATASPTDVATARAGPYAEDAKGGGALQRAAPLRVPPLRVPLSTSSGASRSSGAARAC